MGLVYCISDLNPLTCPMDCGVGCLFWLTQEYNTKRRLVNRGTRYLARSFMFFSQKKPVVERVYFRGERAGWMEYPEKRN